MYSIFDSLPAHIAVLDRNGVIVHVNRTWTEFARANQYEGGDFLGLNYIDMCARTQGPDAAEASLAYVEIRSILAGEQDAFEMVYPCHVPDNTRWFKLFARRFGTGALLMHTDITAEYADTQSPMLPAVLRDMAHEMRTPLNAILGFSELISREIMGPVPDTYREYGGLIQQSGRHLLDLIEKVLDIGRIDAGALELDEGTVDPIAMMRMVSDMMTPLARAKELIIAEACEPLLPPIRADETRLRQILVNLVGNAIKFTPSGGRVELGARITDDNVLKLWVADTGVGIAPEDIGNVLRPFGRTKSAGAQNIEGTGLGLPLALRLTELHGGALALASTPGQGTTVTITLPPSRTLRADPRRTAPLPSLG